MYDEPVNWALKGIGSTKSSSRSTQPTLNLKGVGQIALSAKSVRQLVRLMGRGGEARTLSITRTATGAWRATVCFRGVRAEHLTTNDQVGGVDRGVWVTAALPDGTLLRCPAFLRQARREIAAMSRQRAAPQVLRPSGNRQQGHGQGLPQGSSSIGELGPPYRHLDRRRLRRDLPGGPQSGEHDEIGQGDGGLPRERSVSEEWTQPQSAGRRSRTARLLDLCQGGRGRTQGLEGGPEEHLAPMCALRAYRGGQPPAQLLPLSPVRPRRTRRRERRSGADGAAGSPPTPAGRRRGAHCSPDRWPRAGDADPLSRLPISGEKGNSGPGRLLTR